MGAYTKRFFMGSVAARAVSAPVPSGRVWVVRCVDFTAAGGTIVGWGVGNAGWLYLAAVPTGQDWAQWQGRQVLNEGEFLALTAGGGTADAYATGYELQA